MNVLQTRLIVVTLATFFFSMGCNLTDEDVPPNNTSTSNNTAQDTTPPTLDIVSPASDSELADLTANIVLTFSESIDLATITSESVKLTVEGGSADGVLTDATLEGAVLTLDPRDDLSSGAEYTLTVSAPLADLAGNTIASTTTVTFTTAQGSDMDPPSVSEFSVDNGAADVPADASFTVTFTEEMDAATVPGAITLVDQASGEEVAVSVTAMGATAQVTPDERLAGETLYKLEVSTDAKDLAGNALAFARDVVFTTAAILVLPESIEPGDGATGIDIDLGRIVLSYAEPLDTRSVLPSNVVISSENGDQVFGMPLVEGNNLVIILSSTLTEFETTYTVTVNPDDIADEQRVLTVGRDPLTTFSTSFSTEIVSEDYFYRIENAGTGDHLQVDSRDLTLPLIVNRNESNADVQSWFVTPTDNPAYPYAITTKANLTAQFIEGGGANDGMPSVMSTRPSPDQWFTGQLFKLTPVDLMGEERKFYRIQNLNHGDNVNMAIVNSVPNMVTSRNTTGHYWEFQRLERR